MLFIADQAFLCGTAAQISSISGIENYSLPDKPPLSDKRPITQMLRDRLRAVIEGQDTRYSHWITKIQLAD